MAAKCRCNNEKGQQDCQQYVMNYRNFTIIMGAMAMCGCSHSSKVVDSITDVSITKYLDNKDAAISFTYDDGTLCHYQEIAPELEKRGFRGTFWIVGANIGTDVPDYPYMTWEQVTELSQRGHEMSNHSWTHPNLVGMTTEQIRQEISLCDSAIRAATGKMPITFCYPYNAFDDEVLSLASANRVGTRTFWDAQGQDVSGCTDESLAQWLDSTIAKKAWAVTMTHALAYGWDTWNDPEVLWRLYDRVKQRESEVWVGTFAEVSAYQQEYANTTLTVEKHKDGITVIPSMALDPKLFVQPLTLRIDGDFANVSLAADQGGQALVVNNQGSFLLINFYPSAGPIAIKIE